MKVILSVLLLSLAITTFASATPLQPGDGVELHGWKIEYSSQVPTATSGGQIVSAEFTEKQGNFSAWIFRTNPKNLNEGFQAILNQRTGIVLVSNPTLNAGGPFLNGVSADGSMIALDFGTSPTARHVEVWSSAGHKLLTDTYLHDLRWDGNKLVYAFPEKDLPLDLNEKTRACQDVGRAWQVKQKRFTKEHGAKIDSSSTEIRCSN